MTALVAVVTAAALARPPAVADPGPPLVYAPTGNGPRVTAVPLGGGASGRAPWKLTLSFRCEDQTVDGSFSTRLGRDGRFEQRTEELVTHADVGSDTEVTVRGRLTDRHAEGTIDAHARAYDNAGTTFECTKRGIEWQASAEDDPAATRVDGFFRTTADALAVTAEAVFVDEDRGDKPSVVRRLDPGTGKVTWSRKVGDADRVGAAAERVWLANGSKGQVIGLDARTGKVVATTSVGPGNFDAIPPFAAQPIALTGDGVWVATAQGLIRLDPATGDQRDVLAVGALEGVVSGPTGLIAAAAVPGADGRPAAAQILRIDPATRQVTAQAQIDELPDLLALAAGADAITIARLDKPITQLDPLTLAPLGAVDVVGDGTDVAPAPPGAWVSTQEGLVAVDGSGAPAVRVRGVRGALAANGTTVWLLDRGAGSLVRCAGRLTVTLRPDTALTGRGPPQMSS
jgi:outer membrane protein assembly factor BamB